MSKVSGFTKWSNALSEDVAPGPVPDEISYDGYTTKNLHHSEDARRAFQATIQRADAGQIHDDKQSILAALKATDDYMKLNDMHLEQDVAPDSKEIDQWKQAHSVAREALTHIGEFAHHMDYWHMHEHEIQDLMTKYNPETAGAEMADSYQPQGNQLDESLKTHYQNGYDAQKKGKTRQDNPHREGSPAASMWAKGWEHSSDNKEPQKFVNEELTDKTIKSGDKIKVARVIADMLGVENAESMSPENAVNTGLRKMKSKRMTPEFVGIIKKMLQLADEVGLKVDHSLVPKAVTESEKIDPESTYNAAKGILRIKDYLKLSAVNKGEIPAVGSSLHDDPEDHSTRRMKVAYREEVEVAPDLSDDELEKMANDVDHEDDILHLYDDDELAIVDGETGEEIDDKDKVNEQALNEVLSRIERMKARVRFMKTKAQRERKIQIALKRRSDSKTLTKRARRLAVDMIKQRLMKKPASQMSVVEKERAEKMIQSREALVGRLAMKLAPRIRKLEMTRLSHGK